MCVVERPRDNAAFPARRCFEEDKIRSEADQSVRSGARERKEVGEARAVLSRVDMGGMRALLPVDVRLMFRLLICAKRMKRQLQRSAWLAMRVVWVKDGLEKSVRM